MQQADVQAQIESLKAGVEHFIGEEDLRTRLQAGKRLRVKLGVDPTRPDLTFGHLVVFRKLKAFQDLGHEAILLIGDYTALIGDPSGRSSTRPALTPEEVALNTRTYLEQAFKVLDREKTTVRYNSEWLKGLSFADVLGLTRRMTLARLLERDDFAKRCRENTPISVVELLYPLVQGYDSVALLADVELGGTDQLFNNLVGRKLLEDFGHPPQAVMTLPLLVGLDGTQKMSKSYGNYIAFTDTPEDMFGKVMSISDALMWDYYRLLLLSTPSEIEQLQARHPMEVKQQLALRLTAEFHSPAQAQAALEHFQRVFSSREDPENMPQYTWSALGGSEGPLPLLQILDALGYFSSKNEARRLLEQGGIRLDGQKITDPAYLVPRADQVLQVGKRHFFQIRA